MKSLKEYITESLDKKKYLFKIKVAGDLTEDFEAKLKTLLEKYSVENFTKNSTTPIQSLPLDFPSLRNQQVTIYDTTLQYPATQYELHEYICNNMGMYADKIVVRSPFDPTEAYQTESDGPKGALLSDPNYKELPKIKTDDYYGTKYNQNMLKELAKESKARNKEQGVKIPTEGQQSSPDYGTKA